MQDSIPQKLMMTGQDPTKWWYDAFPQKLMMLLYAGLYPTKINDDTQDSILQNDNSVQDSVRQLKSDTFMQDSIRQKL